ncbi:MAG: family 20 glycosylhydrolase, partial [Victivallales bacterium]
GSERVFSLDDLKRLSEFCRDRFVEVCPKFEIGGHADWWLLGYHPELALKGYPKESDVTHPDHNRIVFNCMLDVIEAMNVKMITPSTDEWWHGRDPAQTPDEVLRGGKTYAQSFLDFHVELDNWLKKRNVRMMIYEDMLNPRHNGKRYDVYKVIDEFPKDVIITQWAPSDIAAAYFLDNGFEVWGSATSYWTYGEKMKSKVDGMGFSTYNLGTDWKLYQKSYSIYEIFMGADNAWNILREKEQSLMDEIASGKLPALREMYALKPNPPASPRVIPLDIQRHMNCPFAEFLCKKGQECTLPEGMYDAGNTPAMFSNQKMNCILLGKGRTMSVPVGKTCSSLIFLHTLAVDEQTAKDFNSKGHWRSWPYGYIAGDYQVCYDDGTVEKLPVRLFWNIGIADSNPLYRTTNDSRYVMPLKSPDGGYRFLYQWEWVNPYPDRKIGEITYVDSNEFNFKILLFALSCRDRR